MKRILFLVVLLIGLFPVGCNNNPQPEVVEDFSDGLSFKEISGKVYTVTAYNGTDTNVIIPERYNSGKITYIDNYVFKGKSFIKSVVIPNSVTGIGSYAFSDCSSLASIVIPDGVISIGDYAFSDCSSLTSIVISDSVISIGDYAFSDCRSLTSIVIPDSVTSIGFGAFTGCRSLTIYAESPSKPSGWDLNWNYTFCPVVWGYTELEVSE